MGKALVPGRGSLATLLTPPAHYRISQSPGLYRIQTIARLPIWVNIFLICWFIPWTGFTIHLYASYFGFVEPMTVKGSLLGTALGFSFFWLMAFLVIVFFNFYIVETRLYENQLEDRFGLPGFVLKTTIDKPSVSNVAIVTRKAYVDDSGEQHEARWELCIDGEIEKALVVFGAFTLSSWSPQTTRLAIESAWTVAELQWLAAVVTKWSGKPLQMT